MVSSSRYTSSEEEEEEKNLNQLQPNSICNSTILSSNEEDNKEEMNLPLGYRFSPHSNELVMHYLLNKIFSQQLPANIIRDIDFYAYDPHQLPKSEFKYGKHNEAYFFTNLEMDAKAQTRRTTKNGYWKTTTGRDKETFHNNAIVGFKKTLMFYEGKAPKGTRTPWVMHEFRVNPSIIQSFAWDETIQRKIESCVVCKVKCKADSDNHSWKANRTNKSAANSNHTNSHPFPFFSLPC